MTDHLRDLPPFIREHIFSKGWTGFRKVQSDAFDVIFDTDDHLLLSAGTSGGKTEAALFPVITILNRMPASSIGALYISPLKALIDDQFDRMSTLLSRSGIRVHSWHGDVPASKKNALMNNPDGILQITPEALQALIVNHGNRLSSMFSDLRFVIIDEVHSFINSDRGLQLLCELETIERVSGCDPRRIGLSATLADLMPASLWLRANSGREVSISDCESDTVPDIILSFHDIVHDEEKGDDYMASVRRFYADLLRNTYDHNCLVFVNNRSSAERTARSLGSIQARLGGNKSVMVHHGGVSRDFRNDAEEALKDTHRKTTIVCTSTLELGIDVGDLDRVVQIEPPYSCSSLLQRMGRSGRNTGRPVMRMMCRGSGAPIGATIAGVPMNLIRAIALVELTVRDRWVEPAMYSSKPFGLLYHQTLVYIVSNTEVRLSDLRRDVLSMYPFRNVSWDEYMVLIRHLISTGHLYHMRESRCIVIGNAGERISRHHGFYAMFQSSEEIPVRYGDDIIGTVRERPPDGELISLCGMVWYVVVADDNEVIVEPSDETAVPTWRYSFPDIHDKVMGRMRDVLASDQVYDYLDERASRELQRVRSLVRDNGALEVISRRGDTVTIHPWVGSIGFETIVSVLRNMDGVTDLCSYPPYTIVFRSKLSSSSLTDIIAAPGRGITMHSPALEELSTEMVSRHKYVCYVPDILQKDMCLSDIMDRMTHS